MSVLAAPITHSGLRRFWELVSDLLIATALIWALPVLIASLAAALGFLWVPR